MRWFALLLIFCVCVPLAAQDPIPDTLDFRLYYPLEVGNVWEYTVVYFGQSTFNSKREIVNDTLIEGREYFIERRSRSERGSPWEVNGDLLLRYDDTTTRLYRWNSEFDTDEIHTCPLGADFGTVVDCSDMGSEETVYGGYGGTVGFNVGSTTVEATKTFAGIADPPGFPEFAAGIGDYFLQIDIGFSRREIEYARISGVEYGVPIPVGTEAEVPDHSELSISVYPNPGSGSFVVAIALRDPQPASIHVFDLLGRRVYSEERFTSAGATQLQLDGSNWPRGLYLFRVTTADGQMAAIRITRQ